MAIPCDVLIIGGGPGGSTSALLLARAGARVTLLEKTQFPRFHIGESFIPHNFKLIQKLGLEPAFRELPHVPKFGGAFVSGDDAHYIRFDFAGDLSDGSEAFNIERGPFDQMLLQQARAAGADVRENVAVRQILHLADNDVRLTTDGGEELHAKWLIDASGQGTVVGRHLGIRRTADDPHLQKAAYFNQFENVYRIPGRDGGHPLIVMHDEGWFWLIPLDDRRTSIGLVMDPRVARTASREQNIPADRMLAWGIARCPAVRNRMTTATGPQTNHVAADFSYRCRPYAGPGYFLVGDAAAFMDPIFSTGVCVAMTGAEQASQQIVALLAGKTNVEAARRAHIAFLEASTATLFKIIRQYYDHSFRELFLEGHGPLSVHRAVIGVLAGNVFPRPPWSMRWRLALFDFYVRLNRWVPLVHRRPHFSLRATEPQTLSWMQPT